MALRISLLTVRSSVAPAGKLSELQEDYLRRCARVFPAESKIYRTESALLENVQEELKRRMGAFWIADPGGQAWTTEDLASRVRQGRDNGLRHLMFGVGPANGWTAQARAAAEFRISLGAMTLPHELAALLLAEQIYRVSTILQGHPYHLGH